MIDRVKVYFNLHKKCWSLKCLDRGKDYGLVKDHARFVQLRGVIPRVSEAGRERVRREGKKNVHAGLVGELVTHDNSDLVETVCEVLYQIEVDNPSTYPVWREITYNPYKHTSFVFKDTGEPYVGSDEVYFMKSKVFAR